MQEAQETAAPNPWHLMLHPLAHKMRRARVRRSPAKAGDALGHLRDYFYRRQSRETDWIGIDHVKLDRTWPNHQKKRLRTA